MLHSVFFALMVGSPTHPAHLTRHPSTPHTPPASARPPTHPPPTPHGSRPAPVPLSACSAAATWQHCLLEAACLAAHALPPGRGMDLNPEMLSASDMQCVGLVVQCMSQCRVHNLNHKKWGVAGGLGALGIAF